MSCVQKNDVITTKNLHIVTRQRTKTGADNPKISRIKEKTVYPNPLKEKIYIMKQLMYSKKLQDKKTFRTVDLTQ